MQCTADRHGASPEVTEAIKRDMYVGDYMGGADTREQAVDLLQGIVKTLWHNKLLMKKWASSDPTIIEQLDPKLKENVVAFDLKDPHHMRSCIESLFKTLSMTVMPKRWMNETSFSSQSIASSTFRIMQ